MPAYGCNLGEAIVRFFKKYAVFKGRASRSEFWWWFLTYTVVTFVLRLVFRTLRNLTDSGVIATVGDSFSSIWGLVVLVPTIALGVRRLHDINMRGTVLAIIYAVQAAAGIFFAIGLILIIGSSLSFRSLEAGNSVSIGGVVLLILGVLAFIASGVFYFVLMARDSNPEGARFDAPTASNAWLPPRARLRQTRMRRRPPRTATSRCRPIRRLRHRPRRTRHQRLRPIRTQLRHRSMTPRSSTPRRNTPHLSRIRWRRLRPYRLCLRCRLFRPCLRHRPFHRCRKCRPSSSIRTSSRIPTLRRIRTLRQYRMIRANGTDQQL